MEAFHWHSTRLLSFVSHEPPASAAPLHIDPGYRSGTRTPISSTHSSSSPLSLFEGSKSLVSFIESVIDCFFDWIWLVHTFHPCTERSLCRRNIRVETSSH